MSQRPRILIAQQQRLALNASLQASIRLLRSDTAGLTRYLEEQTAQNPHLRLTPPEPAAIGDWLPRWSGILSYSARSTSDPVEPAAAQPGLVAHVIERLRAMDLPRPAQRIALALLEALEPSGWLGRSPALIAQDLDLPEDHVLAVLEMVQDIDPAGLFARNLSECLTLQVADQGQLDPEMTVILRHLDLLAVGDTAQLARLCDCDEAEVIQRFRTIRTLNPKPGATFSPPDPAHSREPDLVARPLKAGRWQIALNRSALPSLEVVATPETAADPAALTAARALSHMLKARNDTLLKVGREIANRQVAALAQGPGALKPMTMAEVAASLDLHVSTISRVVAGASLDSPQGVWWLRRMFSGARGGQGGSGQAGGKADSDVEGGPTMAAAALRHQLGRIVSAESPLAPLSDAALADRLAKDTGVRLARRTIAQYREAAGIPAAHRRKRREPAKGQGRRSLLDPALPGPRRPANPAD